MIHEAVILSTGDEITLRLWRRNPVAIVVILLAADNGVIAIGRDGHNARDRVGAIRVLAARIKHEIGRCHSGGCDCYICGSAADA